MIQFEDITKSYPTGTLFKNVNISIKHGMRVGLVGKNGSGKTTLLQLMLGNEKPDSGKIKKVFSFEMPQWEDALKDYINSK